jgi:hypothetical protein
MFKSATRRALSLTLTLAVSLSLAAFAPLTASAASLADFLGTDRKAQPGDFLSVDEFKNHNNSITLNDKDNHAYAHIDVISGDAKQPLQTLNVVLYGDHWKIGQLGAVVTTESGATYRGKVTTYTDGTHIGFTFDKDITGRYELYVSLQEVANDSKTFLTAFTNGIAGGVSAWGYNDSNFVDSAKISAAKSDSVLSLIALDINGTMKFKIPTATPTPSAPLNLYVSDYMASENQFVSANYVIKNDNSLWDFVRSTKAADNVKAVRSINNPTKYMESRGYIIKTDGTLWELAFKNDGYATGIKNYPAEKILDGVKCFVGDGFSTESVYVIKTDNSLWYCGGWTRGNHPSDLLSRIPPVKVLDNVTSVAYHPTSEFDTILAVKIDGTLWGWGSNASGELGDGTTSSRSAPQKIMDNVVTVALGYYGHDLSLVMLGSSYALKSDGTLWAWGNNQVGQLGVGDTENRLKPVQVMESVKFISAGYLHASVVKSDGTLWAMGASYGKTTSHAFGMVVSERGEYDALPIKIADGVKFVVDGSMTAYFQKIDGSLWYWGGNYNVPLLQTAEPKKLLDNAAAVFSEMSCGFAVLTDGSLWEWGYGRDWFFAVQGGEPVGDYPTKPVKIMEGVKLPTKSQPSAPATPKLTASPSKTVFVMGGKTVSVPQAYTVSGNNYLQLRAIAVLLNGTAAQFNVGWDGAYAVIETGKPYTGTVSAASLKETTNVRQSATNFKLDGEVVKFEKAYLIDGDTNYLQLREVAERLSGTKSQFNIYWDDTAKQAVVEPGKAYTGVKSESGTVSNSANPTVDSVYADIKSYAESLGYSVHNMTNLTSEIVETQADSRSYSIGIRISVKESIASPGTMAVLTSYAVYDLDGKEIEYYFGASLETMKQVLRKYAD